jgi:hypothetical protein
VRVDERLNYQRPPKLEIRQEMPESSQLISLVRGVGRSLSQLAQLPSRQANFKIGIGREDAPFEQPSMLEVLFISNHSNLYPEFCPKGVQVDDTDKLACTFNVAGLH